MIGTSLTYVRSHRRELRKEREISLRLREVDRLKDEVLAERTSQLAEREQMLTERGQLIAELELRNAELASFNRTISHDLRNPLTTIKAFIGQLEAHAQKGDHDRLRSDLRRIDAAADKLRRLLDELFELSQVGIQHQPMEEIALELLIRQVLVGLEGPIREHAIEVEVTPGLGMVRGDRAQLTEALRHLVANATQYLGSQETPRIQIGTRGRGPGKVITIRDNGMGIEPQFHEKIFDIFERLDPSGLESTGIGLALVRRIVEFHGGQIWVESEGHAQGSTFCLRLPWCSPG